MKIKIHREPNALKRRLRNWYDRQFIYWHFPDGTEIREPKGRWVLVGFIAFFAIASGIILVAQGYERGIPV